MPPQVPIRQAWTAKERDDIRSQHLVHPGQSYQDIKQRFNEKYAPTIISKSQISKIINPKRPQGASTSIPTQPRKIQPAAARVRSGKWSELSTEFNGELDDC
ncbi:hypothetical protein EV426DRAFT_577619 [Tirmania nivea]|nr:hypothetical protein EV426DRAFT_577619 [Tirmania nivea]